MPASSRVYGFMTRAGHGLRALLLLALSLGLPACGQKSGTPVQQQTGEHVRVGILPEGAPLPNIVLIVIDALRADRLGAYGHAAKLSQSIDGLAATGVTFDNCMAPAPWTLPSIASLFTSYYPGVHRATSYRTVEDMEQGKRAVQSVLSDQFDTLAEVLQANGYQTAGFCANKFIRDPYGFGQGFDHFDSSFADNTVSGSEVNKAALAWLERRAPDKPFFVYLHYMDVHGPYDAAPEFMDPLMAGVEANADKQQLTAREFRMMNAYLKAPPPVTSDPGRFERLKGYREYWVARYEAGVAEMDFQLLQLFRSLKQQGLWNDAFIILLGDHGEALCEHGFWEHGYSQYQTDLHVPLIMRWPGVLPAGLRVFPLASLIDVFPTILEQLRLPPGENLQGISLVDHMSQTVPDMAQMRFAECVKSGLGQSAVFVQNIKLLATVVPGRTLPDGTRLEGTVRRQLFDLATDPGEIYDVSDQYAEQVEELTKWLQKFARTNRTVKPGLVVRTEAVDSRTQAQLESLGYVGSGEQDEEPNQPPPATQPAREPTSQPRGAAGSAEHEHENEPVWPGP